LEKTTGHVICKIHRKPVTPIELEASVHFYTPDGFLFDATPTSTNLGGIVVTGNVVMNCATGVNIGHKGVGIG